MLTCEIIFFFTVPDRIWSLMINSYMNICGFSTFTHENHICTFETSDLDLNLTYIIFLATWGQYNKLLKKHWYIIASKSWPVLRVNSQLFYISSRHEIQVSMSAVKKVTEHWSLLMHIIIYVHWFRALYYILYFVQSLLRYCAYLIKLNLISFI